jgi:transposase, IS5 family
MRDAQRKIERISQVDNMGVMQSQAPAALALTDLRKWLERAERIRTQKRHDKNKLYALHAPEVECIGKGKARKPYEFGVKVSLAVTHTNGLMEGTRSFPGNPYDGHTLAQQLEQTNTLLEDVSVKPKFAIVDLGYRGLDVQAELPTVQIICRGKFASLNAQHKRGLKRRQAIEPAIGHTKHDNRMERCWLKGATGDALHAVLCAAGFNIRWLLRAIAAKGLKGLLFTLNEWARWLGPTALAGQNLSVGLRR